jgi:RNA-directed DNA polymerase
MKDRALQMIVKFVLEPEWEAKFEPNSYGFRPGRRCQDAMQQIWDCIRYREGKTTSEWILDADIKGCFDNIDHSKLLSRIRNFKGVINQWLKSGAIEFEHFYVTKAGTPQGGIISPLLANIALDGMERLFGCENSKGKYNCPSWKAGLDKGISIIRYADDFVAISPTREKIEEYILPKLKNFMAERGLTLNMEKTRIVHRTQGFDFLGFVVQQFTGKTRSVCLVKPSKTAIKRHLSTIKEYLDKNMQATAEDVIKNLNPIIRGWGNYYRYSNAKKTFNYVDYRIWKMLWHWCLRRHKNKGKIWVRKKYFKTLHGRKWIFATDEVTQLMFTASIRVNSKRYAKVKEYNSPFDPSLHQYWNARARGKRQYMNWDPILE